MKFVTAALAGPGIIAIAVLAGCSSRSPGSSPSPDVMAHAGVNDFIEDVHGELGVSNFVTGDSGLAAQGVWICNQLDGGAQFNVMMERFVQANPGILPYTAGRLAGIAVRDICPWHRNDIH
ncbi:DUF732 domain-containing protein [Mycobacterium fragae]|uniref:DUF732 domain-containing protein n=1 Tax=Mycobacterium fragae TaxID=1260918 RepID=UPI000A165184|nr:DUF732 domain-containing protein [Mycobacterium fragae]MCV7401304.1 DUF732 domain-containing protein [Mycobacterium fragae]